MKFRDRKDEVSNVLNGFSFHTGELEGYPAWYSIYEAYVKVEIAMSEFLKEEFDTTDVKEIIFEVPFGDGEGRIWLDDIRIVQKP